MKPNMVLCATFSMVHLIISTRIRQRVYLNAHVTQVLQVLRYAKADTFYLDSAMMRGGDDDNIRCQLGHQFLHAIKSFGCLV